MQQRPTPRPRRPMTRQQYEAMQRYRRQQNMKYMALLAAFAVLLIVAVVLILRPKGKGTDVAVQAVSAVVTEAPTAAVTVTEVPADQPAISGIAGDDGGLMDEIATPAPTAIPTPEPTPSPVPTPRPEGLRSARLRVIGDVMVCEKQLKAYKSTGYDFHPEFDYIKDMLQNADYTMANMEGTVGKYNDSGYSGYPQFNCPETILEALKDSGVDFLTLANNHMLDRWFDGMKNTVTWVEQYGFDHVGAYRTAQERNTPVVCEVNGIKIGFVAYTHSTNTMEKRGVDPDAVSYGVPYLYKSDIEADVKRVKDAGAEVVIAFPHWGEEYVREPDSNQVKYAKKLAMAGVDVIIGSHSHMVQPMGYVDFTDAAGKPRRVFIMFSMGNFLSDHTKQYCDNGIIVEFTINEHEDGSFSCDNVGYIPTYTWQPTEGDSRVLPSGKYLKTRPAGMSDAAYDRMVESYNEITSKIGSEFPVLES